MPELARQIEDARAHLNALERRAAAASCADLGHDWQFTGGRACCCDDIGDCSVPVHTCTRCGDCDYGENDEATEVKRRCAEMGERN